MSQKVRIGLVGSSGFSELWYLPVLKNHSRVHLQAICSKTVKNAREMADKYQISTFYTDYKKMIEIEDLDGICIITPNNTHRDITLTAMQKGLHVICEKPLALNLDEAREMYKVAKSKGIVHSINFTYRENPAVQKMKELVTNRFIGQILEARFEYSADYGLAGTLGWRNTISSGGMGGFYKILAHI